MVKKKTSKKRTNLHRKKKTSKVKSSSKHKAAKKRLVKQTKVKIVKAPKTAPIGEVTHFYNHISVAVIKLHNNLKQGDTIKIEGHGKSFKQKINSMQIEHKKINEAKKGLEIGLKVSSPVKAKDLVYKA